MLLRMRVEARFLLLRQFADPQRTLIQIALAERYPRVAQCTMLRFRFHALGNHEEPKVSCDGHDPFDQFDAARIRLRHKLPVDLYEVEWETAE
jgi:hypothetical protein